MSDIDIPPAHSAHLRQASVTAPDLSWRDLGACQGMPTDLFFPQRGDLTEYAKEICRGCVVRAQCLEYALENFEMFGIWGGTSERQRRRMRRARRLRAEIAAALDQQGARR